LISLTVYFEYLILKFVRTSTNVLIPAFSPMGQYALTVMEDILAQQVGIAIQTHGEVAVRVFLFLCALSCQ